MWNKSCRLRLQPSAIPWELQWTIEMRSRSTMFSSRARDMQAQYGLRTQWRSSPQRSWIPLVSRWSSRTTRATISYACTPTLSMSKWNSWLICSYQMQCSVYENKGSVRRKNDNGDHAEAKDDSECLIIGHYESINSQSIVNSQEARKLYLLLG